MPSKMTLEAQLYNVVCRYSQSRPQAERAIHLLDQGADPNAQNGELFHWAIAFEQVGVVYAFLSHGAKVTPQALETAIKGDITGEKRKTRRMAEILLNHGANPNSTVSYRASYDEDAVVIPVVYTQLMVAASEDNLDAAKLLLERGAKPQTRLPNGLTALKVAAKREKLSLCKLLLDYHADFHGTEHYLLKVAIDKNDTTFFDRLKKLGVLPHPLQWPSGYYNLSLSMAQRMIAEGVSPDANQSKNWSGLSPLQVATNNKDWPLAQFLLEKDAKIKNSVLSDTIPTRRLSPAQFKQQEEALALHQQDPLYANDDEDKNWIKQQKEELAKNQQEDLCGLQLFLKHGADPNSAYSGPPLPPQATDKRYLTRYTNTPLHVAASHNRKGAIKILLQAGAKLETKNSLGMTPLLTAVEELSNEAVPVLLDAGANVEARNEKGKTPLIVACAYQNSATYYAPLAMVVEVGDSFGLVQLLLQHGANVYDADSNGGTALHYAAQSGNIAAMRLLLEKGASLETLSNNGLSPLGAAVSMGQVEATRLLLQHGANPDFSATNSQTPRQIALEPFAMKMEIVGGGKPTPEENKNYQQMIEASSAPIRVGRQKIAALFHAIPEKKP